jgi:hypothetical protein
MSSIAREWMVLIAIGSLYFVWVLVPLVPAILIYKLFPSTPLTVTGPFAGFKVNAGGAFAGYLLIFAGTYLPIIPPTRDIIAGWQREFWILKGDIKLVHEDNSDIPYSQQLFSQLRVVKPLPNKFDGSQATLKIEEEEGGGLPTVVIELPQFDDTNLPLRSMSDKITVDRFNRIITLKEPITIKESSTGGAVRPVATAPSRTERRSTEGGDRPR